MTALLGEARANPAGGDKTIVRVTKGGTEELYFEDAATAAEAMKLMNSYTSSPLQFDTEKVSYFSSLKAFKESDYLKSLKDYWDEREARWAGYSKK